MSASHQYVLLHTRVINGFLNTVGNRLAERWVAVLGPAGLLFVAAVWAAKLLGHADALDGAALVRRSADLVTSFDTASAVAVLTVIALLAAASAASIIASAAGRVVERLWLARRPAWWVTLWVEGRLAGRQVAKGRSAQWSATDAALRAAVIEPEETQRQFQQRRGLLADARNRIALSPPRRPTWIGDRMRVVGERVAGQYGVDLEAAWPRLWLVVPTDVRTEIGAAQAGFTASAVRVGWAGLYLILGVMLWWPAVVVAVALAIGGWAAGRAAAETLASLIEGTVDVHLGELARKLDLGPPTGPPTPAQGREISERLRKGA